MVLEGSSQELAHSGYISHPRLEWELLESSRFSGQGPIQLWIVYINNIRSCYSLSHSEKDSYFSLLKVEPYQVPIISYLIYAEILFLAVYKF